MKKYFIICICTFSCSVAIAQIGQRFITWDKYGENKLVCTVISNGEVSVQPEEKWIDRDLHKISSTIVRVMIPEAVDDNGKTYTVREIGSFAFAYANKLTEVVLPSTITKIGNNAFSNCTSLSSISLPNSLKEIESDAFMSCKSLSSITLPNSLKKIGESAFDAAGLVSITIPDNVDDIGPACFCRCEQLKYAKLPDKLKKMESRYYSAYSVTGFFEDCIELEEVVLGKELESFGSDCFENCKKLKRVIGLHCEITIPSNAFKSTGFAEKYDSIKQTFSFFAEPKIRRQIENWQRKKEYETTEQWKTRVTETSRNNKLNEIIAQVQNDFITQNAPKYFTGNLGNYDADYQAFPISFKNMESIFVKVPQNIAEEFKDKWNKISKKTSPVYGVVNNNLHIVSCTFKYKGKEYSLAQTYHNDDVSSLALNLPPLQLDLANQNNQSRNNAPTIQIDNSLDLNIPSISSNNTNTFAVIIGNERYTRVAQVPYANNDARIFAEYCKKTLGLPDKNVKVYENATYGAMIGAVSDIQKIAKAFKGDANIIFYYAGHGIPDEATGDGYLLPIDADGLNMRVCYPLSQLYKELGEMQARSVTCFLDACFSGSQRGDGMVVAARGVAIKAKSDRPTGHTIVFTAATDKQTAYPYKEKGHGMFTYYLLKKLRDTKGDCTLGELGQYICDEVAKQAIVTNGKEQTPVVLTSDGVLDNWKNMKLK